jgi:hypothetical protein
MSIPGDGAGVAEISLDAPVANARTAGVSGARLPPWSKRTATASVR